MSSEPEIDLELRILLQEIAEDPRAKLFKGELKRPERITLGSIEPVSSGAAGLTRAERELVTVHREEAARLLRLAATSVLHEDPWLHRTDFGYRDEKERIVVPRRLELIRMLDDSANDELEQRGAAIVRNSLEEASRLLGAGSSNASSLAAMSLRLVQDDAAYVELARYLLIQGYDAAAETMLWGVARRARDTLIGAVALSWIGVIQARAGCYLRASPVYRAAAQSGQVLLNDHFSWLGSAIIAGDRTSAQEAMREIDERYGSLGDGVDEWIRARRFEREQSTWPMSIESRRLAQHIASSSDSTARRVADVYT